MSAPQQQPESTSPVPLPLIRSTVLTTTSVFALIVLGLSAYSLAWTTTELGGYFIFSALGIAAGVVHFVTVTAMLIVSRVRNGAFSSKVGFEVFWLGCLGILWLSTGALTASTISGLGRCRVTFCSVSRAISAFSFLSWIALFGYITTLTTAAFRLSQTGTNIWACDVKDLHWIHAPLNDEKINLTSANPIIATQPPAGNPGNTTYAMYPQGTNPGNPAMATYPQSVSPGTPPANVYPPGTNPGTPIVQYTPNPPVVQYAPGPNPGNPPVAMYNPGGDPSNPAVTQYTPGNNAGNPQVVLYDPNSNPANPGVANWTTDNGAGDGAPPQTVQAQAQTAMFNAVGGMLNGFLSGSNNNSEYQEV